MRTPFSSNSELLLLSLNPSISWTLVANTECTICTCLDATPPISASMMYYEVYERLEPFKLFASFLLEPPCFPSFRLFFLVSLAHDTDHDDISRSLVCCLIVVNPFFQANFFSSFSYIQRRHGNTAIRPCRLFFDGT